MPLSKFDFVLKVSNCTDINLIKTAIYTNILMNPFCHNDSRKGELFLLADTTLNQAHNQIEPKSTCILSHLIHYSKTKGLQDLRKLITRGGVLLELTIKEPWDYVSVLKFI